MRRRSLVMIAVALVAGATYWTGCGGDEETTTFSGNVSSVSPALAEVTKPKETRFAFHWPKLQSEAFAQGSCGSNGRLLFCIQTSTYGVCEPVDAGCDFEIEAGIERERDAVVMTFVNDSNGNHTADGGEAFSTVAQSLRYCNGDKVRIANAQVNFTSGFTTATVTKTRDKCTGVNPTQPAGTATAVKTSTPGGPSATNTPAGTGTPVGTPTPIYVSAAPLNTPPSTALAFLFSAGALGLLVPRRRRPDDRK